MGSGDGVGRPWGLPTSLSLSTDLDSGAAGRGAGGVLEDRWSLLRVPGDRTLCVSCTTSLLGLSWRVPEGTVALRNPESVRSTCPQRQAGKPAGASPARGFWTSWVPSHVPFPSPGAFGPAGCPLRRRGDRPAALAHWLLALGPVDAGLLGQLPLLTGAAGLCASSCFQPLQFLLLL